MRSKYAWLLLPPVLALIIFMGPLQNMNGSAAAVETSTEVGSHLPQMPSFWQISSTLIGVLLLGAVFVGLIRKLRENSGSAPGSTLSLRQSLRLSARHQIHAVQYQDQILVLGACDHSISVLHTAEDPGIADDEATVLDRDELEEGAVPRDMILPRPAKPRTKAPTKPQARTGSGRSRTWRDGIACASDGSRNGGRTRYALRDGRAVHRPDSVRQTGEHANRLGRQRRR